MAKKKSQPEKSTTLQPEEMTPQTPEEFIQRGWLYYSRKKLDLAEKDFTTALENQPENIDAHFGLALVLKAAGSTSKALDYFEKSSQLLESIADSALSCELIRPAKMRSPTTVISRIFLGSSQLTWMDPITPPG